MNIPTWNIEGVIIDKRELTTEKGAAKGQRRTWAYSVKIMAMGGTFEMQTKDERLFDSVAEGETVKAVGHFDTSGGQIRLQVERMNAEKSSNPKINAA